MDSIRKILNSRKFQSETPKRLNDFIRRHRREIVDRVTAFSPSLPMDKAERKNFDTNQQNKESKKKNAA